MQKLSGRRLILLIFLFNECPQEIGEWQKRNLIFNGAFYWVEDVNESPPGDLKLPFSVYLKCSPMLLAPLSLV